MARSKVVDAWLARYDNPMKEVVLRVREIVLAADPRIEECIKWQAPTFTAGKKNLASFFPKSKAHASLMFHEGAKIPGKHALLKGEGDTGRVLKLKDVAEVNAAKRGIEAIVGAWLAWKLEESSAEAAPKRKPAPSSAPKRPAPKAKGKAAGAQQKKPRSKRTSASARR